MAIAVVEGAELILSDDQDIRNLAPAGMQVRGIGELDLPAETAQGKLFDDVS